MYSLPFFVSLSKNFNIFFIFYFEFSSYLYYVYQSFLYHNRRRDIFEKIHPIYSFAIFFNLMDVFFHFLLATLLNLNPHTFLSH